MGEISRNIGVAGEEITIEYFCKKILGWRGTSNVEFSCKNRNKHNKRTHDIDFFVSYSCPLIYDTQQCVYISVKYTQLPFNIKKTFVEYANSITISAECFPIDEQFKKITQNVKNSNYRHSQVIFWLNHSENEYKDLAKELSNINADIEQEFDNIYLVDNFRINFLYTIIRFAKQLYSSENDKITFYYPATGINDSSKQGREENGAVFPIQFINSPIIPLRIIDKQGYKILYIAVRENFEEDTMKRLLGLAQSLTSGWCNKIIICFPDYQEIKHSSIRDAIFVNFNQPEFTDMVEIKCYQDTFKSYERNEISEFLKPIETEPEFNIETMLPFGDRLRQLLTQSKVQKNEIQTLLNRRGIYVNSKFGKEELIPILTTSLISPSEFEYIRRRHNAKDVAEKITIQTLIVDNNTTLSEAMQKIEVSVSDAVKKANPDNEIVSFSNFVHKNNGEIEAECHFKRPILTKDWASTNQTQKLKITFSVPKKFDKNTNKINIFIGATSNDAKFIGKDLVKNITNELRKDGVIRENALLEKITANDFANEHRTNFLLSFLSLNQEESKVFKFFGVTDLEFAIADEVVEKLPEDIASLKNKVEQSVFSGRNLEDIKYIKDKNYRNYFIFEVVTAEYVFTIEDIKGKVQIEFGFPDIKTKAPDKVEFEFKIIDTHPYVDSHLSAKQYKELENSLQDEFNRLKISKLVNIPRKYGQQGKIFEQ